MIGGGKDAFIGAVHRMAAQLDGLISLHCGAFSAQPASSLSFGKSLGLKADKCYPDFQTMIDTEHALPPEQRMDFLSIVTPNHLHYEAACYALQKGFHVMIDKPMTLSLKEAKHLKAIAKHENLTIAVSYAYSAYPMVWQARRMIDKGALGPLKKIVVQYSQGWLSQPEEQQGNKQAVWRTDPASSGLSGCMGDIGTHAAQLAEHISGLKILQLCADINTLVPGRALDDDGQVFLKFEKEVKGLLMATQIATGEENNLSIHIYGEKGSIEWQQMEPNTLKVLWCEAPIQLFRTGGPGLYPEVQKRTRLPSGHPEGYIEAFANVYQNFALQLMGKKPKEGELKQFPDVDDGIRGMAFIEAVIASGKSNQKWYNINT